MKEIIQTNSADIIINYQPRATTKVSEGVFEVVNDVNGVKIYSCKYIDEIGNTQTTEVTVSADAIIATYNKLMEIKNSKTTGPAPDDDLPF